MLTHWHDQNSSTTLATGDGFTPGAWYHVATTVDQALGIATLYVNGIVFDQLMLESSDNFVYGDDPWYIGIGNPGASSYRYRAHVRLDVARAPGTPPSRVRAP